MLSKKDKPRAEFKSKAAEIIAWCSDVELNLLRVKINAEIQFRVEHWGKIADKSIKTGGKTVHDKRANRERRLKQLAESNKRSEAAKASHLILNEQLERLLQQQRAQHGQVSDGE
jgi:hypothetical protein